MNTIRIRLSQLGNIHASIDFNKLRKWNSCLFSISSKIDRYDLPRRAEGANWEYPDSQVAEPIPEAFDADVLVVITNAPLESNYYMRRLAGNRVCVTLFEVDEILARQSIPYENFLLKCLYEIAILYLVAVGSGGDLPQSEVSFTHDDTRGCLFDMTGIKTDLAVSSKSPGLCDSCYNDFSRLKVPLNVLDMIRKELRRVRIPLYYRLINFIKNHPLLSILITIFVTIVLNIISSFIFKVLLGGE